MDDYIKRKSALAAVSLGANRHFISEYIREIPAEDVQPVRHGHWIKDGHHITCDQCGQSMCDKDREGDTIPQNFCPNCGVRMDGEQNG